MGEAKRRKELDPLYGIVSNTEHSPPLWYIHRDVLVLLGGNNNLTFISGRNRLPDLTEDEVKELDKLIDDNPYLLPETVHTPVPTVSRINDIDTQTINLL